MGSQGYHDWDDLTAEASSVYALGHGGLIENVLIAVREPGTERVVARYFFSHDIEEGRKCWDIARLYMQRGPEGLPEFVHLPHNWNNDAEIGLIRRLAPKVHSPPEIDRESGTAPSAHEPDEQFSSDFQPLP